MAHLSTSQGGPPSARALLKTVELELVFHAFDLADPTGGSTGGVDVKSLRTCHQCVPCVAVVKLEQDLKFRDFSVKATQTAP